MALPDLRQLRGNVPLTAGRGPETDLFPIQGDSRWLEIWIAAAQGTLEYAFSGVPWLPGYSTGLGSPVN